MEYQSDDIGPDIDIPNGIGSSVSLLTGDVKSCSHFSPIDRPQLIALKRLDRRRDTFRFSCCADMRSQ
jgi:hypothetical protein